MQLKPKYIAKYRSKISILDNKRKIMKRRIKYIRKKWKILKDDTIKSAKKGRRKKYFNFTELKMNETLKLEIN